MAKLTTSERNALPDSAFAGPNRSYPVNDEAHAKNAKARASQFASPELKAKVFKKADKKLGKSEKKVEIKKSSEKKSGGYK